MAGLLNVREKNSLKFIGKKSSQPESGSLHISDYTQLWVVDMQHRLEGIKKAFEEKAIKDFSFPVLITEGLEKIEEAAQFYVINTKSKRMGVDLCRRLLIEHNRIQDIVDTNEWELKAVKIAIELNKLPKDNPWYGRIRPPEQDKLQQHIATE
jgi:hypothetical protein